VDISNHSCYSYRVFLDNCPRVAPQDRPVSLPQLVMKITGGITERNLVLVLLAIEVVFAALAVMFYL